MMLTDKRRRREHDYTGGVPKRTPKHDLNDSAAWLYVAIQGRMDEYIETPVSEMDTVQNCIGYLQSQILVLELIASQLRKD